MLLIAVVVLDTRELKKYMWMCVLFHAARDAYITHYKEKWSMLTCDRMPCNLL